MKVQFTGYHTFKSYKNNPEGQDLLQIGIVYKDPDWEGLHSEARFIPYTFLDTVSRIKTNSVIVIEEFNKKIMDIYPLDK